VSHFCYIDVLCKSLYKCVIIPSMKGTPFKLKQKLSPEASKAKAERDLAFAKTPVRRLKKAQNQKIGQRSDSDLHHTGSGIKRVSIKNNRGNFGDGTKNE